MQEISITRLDLKHLYEQIGGEDRLQAILDDFYQRMAADVLIGFFFHKKDLAAIAKKQKEFLLRAMGVTRSYSGKAPAQAHDALPPILRGHFDRRLRILEETLLDYGMNPKGIRTWMGFENTFRDGIQSFK